MRLRRFAVPLLAMLITNTLVAALVASFTLRHTGLAAAGADVTSGTRAGEARTIGRAETTASTQADSRPGQGRAPTKSYAFYVGKNRSESGHVLLGGTGEEPSSHWLDIVPRQQHAPDEEITVGVTSDASIPGKLTKIPQAEETQRYITMRYSEYSGFPPPLTNGGLNESQVAIRDVWSPSRDELVERTPTPQTGPNYSDLARIALQRAETAREAVEVIGGLIDEYGYSTYGGNTHIIADPNEGWIVKEMAGGEGLWVAERLGADEIRVAYPGYIGNIPRDYQKHPDYMGSDNLISFAAKKGWYDPDSGRRFNVHKVYGDGSNLRKGPKLLAPKEVEKLFKKRAPVDVDEMMTMVRDPRIADDEAGYGQVARLRAELPHPKLMAMLWVAPTGSITAPFIPWRMGVQKVPPEFRMHRYLTKDSAPTFLDNDFQSQEATQFAGRVFKRLMYYTCAHPKRFLGEVTTTLEAFEGHMLAKQRSVEDTALALIAAGEKDSARQYLTYYSNTQAMKGLELGNALVSSLDARTQVLYDNEQPKGIDINRSYEDGDKDSVDCLLHRDGDVASEDDGLPDYAG